MNVKPTLIDGNVAKASFIQPSIRQTQMRQPLANGPSVRFSSSAFRQKKQAPVDSAGRPVFTPAEPRREFDPCEEPSQSHGNDRRIAVLQISIPDEYIFDGGDRNAPAGYVAGQRSGFDSEDTVAKYKDHTGDARTSPSNRVCVYAPRFGSVRTVTGLQADTKVDKAAGARDSQGIGNIKTGNAAQENVHDTILSGLESRNRVDGMESATPADAGTTHRFARTEPQGGRRPRRSTLLKPRLDGTSPGLLYFNSRFRMPSPGRVTSILC